MIPDHSKEPNAVQHDPQVPAELVALFGMTPPSPVPGCSVCAEFTEQRRAARAAYDGSRETDVNVLMRRHREQAHPG